MRMIARRMGLAALLLLGMAPLAQAQGTVAPVAKQQFLDTNGNPLANGRLYVYEAGTTTPATIYTDQTLVTPALNAAVCACSNLDASGRFTYFLAASSYRFVLKTSADVLVWDVDGVSSVPVSTVNLDVDGLAGESLTAGDVVYLSAGDGARTAGSWYKADATNAYSSVTAVVIGMVPTSIASAASGTIRLAGHVSNLSALVSGSTYVIATTPGSLTATPPATNIREVGIADSTSTLVLAANPRPAPGSGIRTVSATAAVVDGDGTVLANGTFTVTLPTAVGRTGTSYRVKNIGTGTITVATTSAQTIDGATTFVIASQYDSITVQSNGANWFIL